MADFTIEMIAEQQHRAVARLHLKFTGVTHELLGTLFQTLRGELDAYTLEDGRLNPVAAGFLSETIANRWRETFADLKRRFENARRQAALISFGALAVYHNEIFAGAESALAEVEPILTVTGTDTPFFEPQLEAVLKAAADRVYGDGFNLSQRIWRLDEQSLADLQQIIMETIATGDSAWNAAKRLESLLGMGQECPRWTSTRLFQLTKADIATGDQRGLVKGHPCKSAGVAYKALRLARNEIQIVHQAANDAIFARMPWIEREKINLSPSHPPIGCRCEEIVIGGEDGDGVYPKGTITLPVHVQCLCFKTAVLAPADEFAGRLRGWLRGEARWPEMDSYATWLGASRSTVGTALEVGGALYKQLMLPLDAWLEGDEAGMDELLEEE